MNNLLKILRINTFIQSLHGTVYLDGNPVMCVTLAGTFTLKNSLDGIDGLLTDAQVTEESEGF